MSLVILTQPIKGVGRFSNKLFITNVKRFIKFLLGQSRGPQAVTKSLLVGLKKINIDYVLNPKKSDISTGSVVYVNESAEALRGAIELKKAGIISKIITGPTIAILPNEEGGVLLDTNIDIFLVPSIWTKDFWVSQAPQLAKKIEIWAAGVESECDLSKKRDLILVYYKSGSKKRLRSIMGFLKSENISYKIVNYGHYSKKEYFTLLARSKGMIYLSESESQGLALCEAWMHNVPTMVWNRGYWEYCNYKWFHDKISAPYLTEECGLFFGKTKDFPEKWRNFIGNLGNYKPRDYALKNFTNESSARRFINLIKL
ncbi:MAG: hypothetical protein ABIJ84_03215 [bacterium]